MQSSNERKPASPREEQRRDDWQVAFGGLLTAPGGNTTKGGGIWATDASGALRLVALKGDVAPGVPGGQRFATLYDPVLDNRGDIAFLATVGDPIRGNTGIWLSRDGRDITLGDFYGDPVQAIPGALFSSIGSPSINDFGQIVFAAGLKIKPGGVDATNDGGIFLQDRMAGSSWWLV